MGEAFDDIRHLASSPKRVRLLTYLQDTEADRKTILTETEIAPSTLSRILTGFRDRGWIIRNGRTYQLSSFGRQLADQYTTLIDIVELNQKLHQVREWLPVEEMDIDIEHFENATLTISTPIRPTDTVARAVAITRTASEMRFLANAVAPQIVAGAADRVFQNELTIEGVLTRGVTDAIANDPELAGQHRDLLASDGATLYRYDGQHPHRVAVFDGTLVAFLATADDRLMPGIVETDDATVLAWATDTIDAYRDESVRLSAADFTG